MQLGKEGTCKEVLSKTFCDLYNENRTRWRRGCKVDLESTTRLSTRGKPLWLFAIKLEILPAGKKNGANYAVGINWLY